jgi:hypothetical protein
VNLYYPPDARETAFHLYKSSFDLGKDLYWFDREKIADHGRVNRETKLEGREVPADWLERVDARTQDMLAKIDELPDRGAFKEQLRQGALAVSYLSKACGLQLGASGDSSFLATWKESDPESFEELRGDMAMESLKTFGLPYSLPLRRSVKRDISFHKPL